MARLRATPVSDAHLLCLMEVWFDRTQPIVEALADFSYTWAGGDRVGCPFCQTVYPREESVLIIGGMSDFEHPETCPVVLARKLRKDMLG